MSYILLGEQLIINYVVKSFFKFRHSFRGGEKHFFNWIDSRGKLAFFHSFRAGQNFHGRESGKAGGLWVPATWFKLISKPTRPLIKPRALNSTLSLFSLNVNHLRGGVFFNQIIFFFNFFPLQNEYVKVEGRDKFYDHIKTQIVQKSILIVRIKTKT